MPSAISTTRVERRSSSAVQPSPTTYKFPDISEEVLHLPNDSAIADGSRSPSPSPRPLGIPPHLHSNERWQGRRSLDYRMNGNTWGNGTAHITPSGGYTAPSGGPKHGRQKSLSEAIRNVRGRKNSVSQNAHEIADALKAPISGRLIVRRKIIRKTPQLRADLYSSSFVPSGTPPPFSQILLQSPS